MTKPSQTRIETSSEDTRFEALLLSWFERIARGESPQVAEHCASSPELAPRLERIVAREARLLSSVREQRSSGAAPTKDAAGLRLGDFSLLRALGEGGMGRVYLARQESLGRLVAVKVLRTDLDRDSAATSRFRREAEVAASLDHPNIVPVYATGENEGFTWIAMKLLDAPSLDALESPLSPIRAAEVGRALASALHAAHEAGIVHRDVKPANVILSGDIPYLLDFGLARARGGATLTREGAVPGTLPYMAPEQLQGRTPAFDPRADIYALGATLYELVSGSPPFESTTNENLVRKIFLQDPPPLDLLNPYRDFEAILGRALEKSPEMRFETALEMADDLGRFLEGTPVRSRRLGPVRRLVRRLARHPVATSVVALVLVALIVTGALFRIETTRRRDAAARRLADVRSLINDGGDWLKARREFPALRDLGVPAAEVSSLEQAASAREALDAVLDQVQSPPVNQDPSWMNDLVRRLVDADVRLAAGAEGRLARAAVALLSGHRDEAKDLLSAKDLDAALPRAHAAFLALIRGSDPVAALAAVSAEAKKGSTRERDDHVLAALALRLASSPSATVERELEQALAIDSECYRALYGMALIEESRGNLAAARLALLSLRGHERHRPLTHIALSRIELAAGRLEAARHHLAAAEEALVDLDWNEDWLPIEVQWIDLNLHSGDPRAARERLEKAVLRWPDHPWLRMQEGYEALRDGHHEPARDAFEAAARLSREGWHARSATLALLQMDLAATLGGTTADFPTDPSEEQREQLRELLRKAVALSREAQSAADLDTEAQAALAAFHARRVLDGRDAAWPLLERAGLLGSTGPSLHFAVEAVALLSSIRTAEQDGVPVESTLAPRLLLILERARVAATRVARRDGDRTPAASPAQRVQAAYLLAEIAADQRDDAALTNAIHLARSVHPKPPSIEPALWNRLDTLERTLPVR